MKRFLVVAALFILSLITYIDRAAISSAKGPISAELSLSDTVMGAVFGAFALGYAMAQVPAGWLADRFGPRLMLAVEVLAWSALTALTGTAHGIAALLTVRLLFGVAEAGAFPGSARAIYNWLGVGERGLANGIIVSGSRMGAAIAFPLMAWLFARKGWRVSFVLLGAAGLCWAILWAVCFRDHPAVSRSGFKPSIHSRVKWGLLFRSGRVGLAMAQYFASNFTFFLCLSWMYPYLQEHYRLSPAGAARYAMMPLIAGATSQWIAGFAVDLLYRSRWRAWSQRLPAMGGFLVAAGGVFALTLAETPVAVVACFTIATFGTEVTISPSWSFCQDIGAANSGAVSGIMNMAGNLGAFASATAFPLMSQVTGNTTAYFQLAALMDVAAMACWLGMRSLSSAAPEGVVC